jgi:hypothetical protein
MSDVAALPTMKKLPAGVAPATAGDQEAFVELFTGFAIALLSAVGLVFGVLVLLFRSFFKPITILSALPLAIGGAFLALMVTGQSLSMPSLIGFLMLMGLAAKNSILLVEYAIEQERSGMSQREAIIDACHERARPIVMTTLAMMAGMLPTALGLGTGSEFRQPMAVAVIGGLITSTVLSLVLVPVVYEIVDDFEHWLTPKLSRMTTPREASGARGPVVAGRSPLGAVDLVEQGIDRPGRRRRLAADRLAPRETAVQAVGAPRRQAVLVHLLAQVDAVQLDDRQLAMELVEARRRLDGDISRASFILARTQARVVWAAVASAQQRASGTPCGA